MCVRIFDTRNHKWALSLLLVISLIITLIIDGLLLVLRLLGGLFIDNNPARTYRSAVQPVAFLKLLDYRIFFAVSFESLHHSLMKCGIDQARRAWLGKDDVINTYPLGRLLKLLRGN